ncbi:MAG: ATP-binding protein, partial [Mesorhizobium sp.]
PEQAEFIATMPLSVIGATLRPGRSVAHAIKLMVQASAPRAAKDISGPTLDDLHGLGEAGEWGRELATDLADWRAGTIGWADVDRGILLSGPPGTGKTTFAGALARTCNVHLVLGSLGRWQAKGHLGDLLKAMRAAFDDARKNAPSIIFIDEIDAVGDREKFTDHNAQY